MAGVSCSSFGTDGCGRGGGFAGAQAAIQLMCEQIIVVQILLGQLDKMFMMRKEDHLGAL